MHSLSPRHGEHPGLHQGLRRRRHEGARPQGWADTVPDAAAAAAWARRAVRPVGDGRLAGAAVQHLAVAQTRGITLQGVSLCPGPGSRMGLRWIGSFESCLEFLHRII